MKTRITLATLAVFLASIWTSSYVAMQLLQNDVREMVSQQQASVATLVASQINRELEERFHALQTVAALASEPMQAGPAAMQAFLDTRLDLQSLFDSRVFVAQPDGLVIAAWPLGNGPVGYNLMDRDYLAAALKQGKSTTGRPWMSKTNGPVIVMATPILDTDGAVIGALAASLSLASQDVFDQITENRFGKTGGYVLVAPEHRLIITSTDRKQVFSSLPAPGESPVIDRFVAGAEGEAILRVDDEHELVLSVKSIPATGWQVSASLPLEEAYQPVRQQQRRIAIATLIVTLFAGLLVWWILRRHLMPLQTTARKLALLSAGDQAPDPLPVARNDEIGMVIEGFNRLIRKLSEREATLRQVLDAASVAIFLADDAGRIQHANRRLCEMFGLSPESVIGLPFTELLPPADREETLRRWAPCLTGAVPEADFDRVLMRHDQSEFWGHLSVRPYFDSEGHCRGHITVIADITVRKLAEQALEKSKQQYDEMAARIPIGIYVLRDSVAGVFTADYVSPRTSALFGIDADTLRANPEAVYQIIHPEERDHFVQIHVDARAHRTAIDWQGRVVACDRIRWLHVYSTPEVQDDGDVIWRGLVEDVTEAKEYERRLEQVAHYDSLTGLPNRVLLGDRLKHAMAQVRRTGKQLVVACLDVDDFRSINDKFGHDVGDQMLIALADSMRRSIREGDTLARLGGDEFVAVFLDLDEGGLAISLLERLLSATSETIRVANYMLRASSSIGVAYYASGDTVDADQLLRQADQAMYQAKIAGKNRYHVFDADQDRSLRGWNESLEDIRRGLAQNEFVLFYQPKVNMRSGAIVGAEALIRWRHPEKGLLPPATFLPMIENHPLALEIGEWVIEAALRQMERWGSDGSRLRVSVNIGALQLQQAQFLQTLRQLLTAHPSVNPRDLTLEILESSALEDLKHVAAVIEQSQSLGVGFALDDFGTGYSSLTYLKRLSVNQLKIDQSFVRHMLDDPNDLAILEGVIGLARAFHREVVAEGVETDAHGEMLLLLGCELAQGYGIARPMPAEELPAWAASWQPNPYWKTIEPVNRENLLPIFAAIEERASVLAVEKFLNGLLPDAPRESARQCRLGQWLDSDGHRRFGDDPELRAVRDLHLQAHELAHALCERLRAGQQEAALDRLPALQAVRDEIMDRVKRLVLDAST